MDHRREHRTSPLARVMGVGRQQHHMGEAYSIAGLMTAINVSFCLPHPVAGSGVNRVPVVLSGFSVKLLCFP